MLEENKWLGILTLLDDEKESTNNFFKSLSYRNNYKKIISFLESLSEKIPEDYDLEIESCFNYLSEDEFINSFRQINFIYNKELLNEIKLIKKDYNISIKNTKKIISVIFN